MDRNCDNCLVYPVWRRDNLPLLRKKIKDLDNELEFYKECSLREAEILFVDNEGNFVVVYDEYLEHFIEIDVFPEIIHCTIEVGDTALYEIDMGATDADLLGIIKKP